MTWAGPPAYPGQTGSRAAGSGGSLGPGMHTAVSSSVFNPPAHPIGPTSLGVLLQTQDLPIKVAQQFQGRMKVIPLEQKVESLCNIFSFRRKAPEAWRWEGIPTPVPMATPMPVLTTTATSTPVPIIAVTLAARAAISAAKILTPSSQAPDPSRKASDSNSCSKGCLRRS